MPGKETELTARLKPSRRQFFQWHLKEKFSLRNVKDKMDELTKALNAAGYDYNFVADVKAWKNRSRYWNSTAKKAWNVQPNQKGRDLSVPEELTDVPIWIQWGQDVGDWRSNKSKGNNHCVSTTQESILHPSVAHAPYHQGNHRDQDSTLTVDREALPSTNEPLHFPETTMNHSGILSPGLTTEALPLPPQSSNYHATVFFPSLPQPDQTHNALQGYAHYPNNYYQNYQLATPTSNVTLPFPSSIHGNHRESMSYLSNRDLSHTHDANWPWERPESTVRDPMSYARTSYPHEYTQKPSGSDLHGQQQSTGFTAEQPPAPHRPRRTAGQDGYYHYDSALR